MKVLVRYVVLGVIIRRFLRSGYVGNVYDWVGLLSLILENFIFLMVGNSNFDFILFIDFVD